MFRIVLPAFALFLASPVGADDTPPCDPSTMNCSPLVACVEATGEILRGASFGVDDGPFHAMGDDGVLCVGTWRRGPLGVGLATFSCSDGRLGQAVYTFFEPESGTAVGTGHFSEGGAEGGEVRFWSGNNLERYFREVAPEERQRMACEPDAMLLS
jgi:hypothetical protein